MRQFRSVSTARGRVAHLTAFFGRAARAAALTTYQIRQYQLARRAAGAATGTINRETSALHRMGTLAVHWGWLDTVPGFPDRLRENPPRQGFFEHPEYLAVRAHLPGPWQDILDVAYYSGWRKNEILGLTWEEIDEAGGVIRLSPARSKTLVGRMLPISQPIAEALARRRAHRDPNSPLVFHRDGIAVRRWRTAWRTACQVAGVPTRFLHDCRRTAARNLIRANVPERVAMLLTGHKSRAIFDRYNIINEQELLDAGDQLVAYLAQQAQAVPARQRPHPAGPATPRPAPPLRLVRRTTAQGHAVRPRAGRQWPDTARLCAAAHARATGTNRPAMALLHEDPLWVAACPTLLGTLRRSHTTGMKSQVHPTYKTKYRVANWPAYNRALVRRGDVTVWVSSEAIAAWTASRSGRRGGPRRYSDLAIETALTLRLRSHLPLRQAEGFLHALFGMMRLDLSVPDDTMLSRRSQHLRRRLRSPVPPDEGLHLVLDSTGLSLVGAGEWAAATHGGRGRRGWRKLHRGVDQSGAILVHTLTEATGDDATTALDLLTAVEGPLVRITADAASDTVAVYETATARGATVVIPPARTATVSGHGPRSPARDRTITAVKQLGRRRLKKTLGYHRQSRVENTFFRDTSIIGDGLRARSPAGQGSEVVLGCAILNRMTELGRPVSYRIAR